MTVRIRQNQSDVLAMNGWLVEEEYDGVFIPIDHAFPTQGEARERLVLFIQKEY